MLRKTGELVIESVVRDKNHYNKMKHVAVTKGIIIFVCEHCRVAIGEKLLRIASRVMNTLQ